jgi:hypothetical protein
MSGKGDAVVPFPLYYRLGPYESLSDIASRYPTVIRLTDPYLQTASIQGFNPLELTGTYMGMILAALEYQITEANSLLRHPYLWEDRFTQALLTHPDTLPAVQYFRELADASNTIRDRQTSSLLTKVSQFTRDDSMIAMFGANTPGIIWDEVVDKGLLVLLDFGKEQNDERRRFKMMWAFHYFEEYIKRRGSGPHKPISFIIDELMGLLSIGSMAGDALAVELDNLINVLARNRGVWLTVCSQELFQFSERLQKTLMTMGTHILGVTSDPDTAWNLARQFYRYDPYWVRKYEPVYGSFMGSYFVIDHRSTEYSVDEQHLMASHKFMDQGRFHFLVRPASGEGDTRGNLTHVSIDKLDQGQWPDTEITQEARRRLVKRDGIRSALIMDEIKARSGYLLSGKSAHTSSSESDIPPVEKIEGDG